jgi:hypothetical protein
MLFPEYQEPFTVWRGFDQPEDPFVGDRPWVLAENITGRIEPVAGTEEFLHNQDFHNVTEVIFCPIDYAGRVHGGDGIIDSAGKQMRVVGEPEVWKYMMPYVMLKVEKAQFPIGS